MYPPLSKKLGGYVPPSPQDLRPWKRFFEHKISVESNPTEQVIRIYVFLISIKGLVEKIEFVSDVLQGSKDCFMNGQRQRNLR